VSNNSQNGSHPAAALPATASTGQDTGSEKNVKRISQNKFYKSETFASNKNKIQDVRFEIFTSMTMKYAVFWDVAQCRSCVNRRFGGTYRLHLAPSASVEPA
jgi:hypothetical protein